MNPSGSSLYAASRTAVAVTEHEALELNVPISSAYKLVTFQYTR